MTLAALLATVTVLVFVPAAGATHEEPVPPTYAKLLSLIDVEVRNCPGRKAAGCYPRADQEFTQRKVVYVERSVPAWARAAVAEHEIGHVIDRWLLSVGDRDQIAGLLGWGQWQPERFADLFAACSISKRKRAKLRRFRLEFPRPNPTLCVEIDEITGCEPACEQQNPPPLEVPQPHPTVAQANALEKA